MRPETPVVSEEEGSWVVRIPDLTGKLGAQEYRCTSEDVARAFAARFLSPRTPPTAHGAVSRARLVDSGPWWWRRRR